MSTLHRRFSLLPVLALLPACTYESPLVRLENATELRARLDFGSRELSQSPFPAPQFVRGDASLALENLGPQEHSIFRHVLAGLALRDGFGVSTGAWFPLTAEIENRNQIRARSSESNALADSPFVLFDVDLGVRMPVLVDAIGDTRPYGPEHTLAILPEQGVPLLPAHLYAVWVNVSGIRAAGDLPVRSWDWGEARAALCAPDCPAYIADLDRAWAALRTEQPTTEVFAFTAFRTGNPQQLLQRRLEAAREHAFESVRDWQLVVTQPEYCGYEAQVSVPVFQRGAAPYNNGDGDIVASGASLAEQRREIARVFLSLPRTGGSQTEWPTAVLVRAGAGADRALFDRGVVAMPGGAPEAERGIAVHLARAGYAGISIDGPQGGVRNQAADEQFNFFAITNQRAMVGNLEQSAYELAMLPAWLQSQRTPVSACDAAPSRGFSRELVLIGHSTGASIAPLAAAFVEDYRALVLSGAGGSFAANLMYKEQPLMTRPLVAGILGVPTTTLSMSHPALQLFQWSAEHVDTQVVAAELARPSSTAPRDLLIVQGIVDRYIPPPVANALQAALHIDQGGAVLDAAFPSFRPLSDFFSRSGRSVLALPVVGNVMSTQGSATAAVVQLPEDGVQDGHEVFWQRSDAHALLRCFLRSRRMGRATIGVECPE